MDGFKQWFYQQESSGRTRAAMSPSIPAQAGLIFSKPPYSQMAFCKKVKQPGVRTDNIKVSDVCPKQVKK